ncbi:MAG: hypothetical protein HQ483_09690 [Rhodospirillales bacterium]|nr:hypothetical protein [Rhodospirillales bacterium]
MFLNALNDSQRRSFLALAARMALADGHISPREIPLLRELGEAFGHDLEFPVDEVNGPVNTAPFDSRASRILTLLGVFVVAYADKHLHVDESVVLSEIIVAFGFHGEDLVHMKSWAKREAEQFGQLALMVKGEENP